MKTDVVIKTKSGEVIKHIDVEEAHIEESVKFLDVKMKDSFRHFYNLETIECFSYLRRSETE